jgi:protein associated with RNAse G/E
MADTPSTRVTIHKLNADGKELWCYEGLVLEHNQILITLEARFDRDDVDIEDLQLRRGDRFVETFYFDRWYNVFEIYQEETNLFKGWYCNITRPAWLDGIHLFAEDLGLDLIVMPDRRMTVVDQDDFDKLTIPAVDRIKAREALDELIDFAMNAVGLFKRKI